jgi:hypothetical protein
MKNFSYPSYMPATNQIAFRNMRPELVSFFDSLNKKGVISLEKKRGGAELVLNKTHLTEQEKDIIKNFESSAPALLELFLTCKQIEEGIKILKLDQLTAESLQHTILNLAFEEYRQPFPTITVVVPSTYFQDRVIPCMQVGQPLFDGSTRVFPSHHVPLELTVNFQDDMLSFGTYFSSGQSASFFVNPDDKSITLNEAVENAFALYETDSTREELDAVKDLTNIALNGLLLLEVEGYERLGPENKEKFEELRKYIKHAESNKRRGKRIDQEKLERSKRELKATPILYSFDRNVKVYTRETTNTTKTGALGTSKGPHWRRSHWHRFRVGPRTGEVKYVVKRVPSVLVNGHLFAGHMTDAKTTYEVKRQEG